MIKIKRIYNESSSEDGYRILIDRLWARGVAKDEANMQLWMKDLAPSNELRKWFGHDPAKWGEFQAKYRDELKDKKEAFEQIKALEKQHGTVTLLYSAKDEEHNNAVVLQSLLNGKK